MAPEDDTRRRINVTFPEALLDLMEQLVPSRERNAFIVAATEKALQEARLLAILASLQREPAWSDQDHPGLATEEDVERYVRTLREAWTPRDWNALSAEDEANDSASAG